MNSRRFIIEEVGNGWSIKVTDRGDTKMLGRYVFTNFGELMEWLTKELEKGATE